MRRPRPAAGAAAVAAILAGAAVAPNATVATSQAQATFHPAQYVSGSLPGIAPLAVGGGQVLLEVTVTQAGAVADVKTLRSTPPFTDGLVGAVRGWQFRPAERLRPADGSGASAQPPRWERMQSTVLAGSVIRPPTMNTPTLGQPPVEAAPPSAGTPFPLNIVTPIFPPQARDGGSVLLEIAVGTDGGATGAKVASPAAGNLVESALAAARAWTFRPAVVDGAPVPAFAYLIFVFRQPVLGPADCC